MAAFTCNPNTRQTKTGGLQVWIQLVLRSETLSQDTNHSKTKNTSVLWGDPDLEFMVSTSSDIFHTAAASAILVLRSKTVQPQSHTDITPGPSGAFAGFLT